MNYYMGIDVSFNKDLSAIAIGHLEENKIKIDYLKSKRTKSIKELTKWIKKLTDKYSITCGVYDQYQCFPIKQDLENKGLSQFSIVYSTAASISKSQEKYNLLKKENKIEIGQKRIVSKDKKDALARCVGLIDKSLL